MTKCECLNCSYTRLREKILVYKEQLKKSVLSHSNFFLHMLEEILGEDN
jgi:hypothetical protein